MSARLRILWRPVFSVAAMVAVFALSNYSLVTGSGVAQAAAILVAIVQAAVVFGVPK